MSKVADIKEQKPSYKQVYSYGEGIASPPIERNLLGGKGIGLAEMASIGIPVPPGFILSTVACNEYRRRGNIVTNSMKRSIEEAMKILEKQMNKEFGGTPPLLVSVRSGARVSMPGMMDTILNLGLNDETVVAFAEGSGNERLAYDNYRRFISLYGEIVAGIERKIFDKQFNKLKELEGAELDIDLSIDSLKEACRLFKKIYEKKCSNPFPQDLYEQLYSAISAVFDSWDSERCSLFRKIHDIPDDWGTAVTVQAMVFGNKNDRSATGVGFTRNPSTGEKCLYGEFLLNAQGEEVVAGIRTPHPINNYQKSLTQSQQKSLEELLPDAYNELHLIAKKLEKHYKDMQDIEFTIDDGKLFMLQTRSGKRTGFAAIRIAVEMLEEGLIDEKTALKRVAPSQLEQLLAPLFNSDEKARKMGYCVARGLGAGPGAASGKAAFTSEQATAWKRAGIDSILVREESCPDDFPGLVAAKGVVTTRGGATSHAAVVARGMGKPCVVGCGALHINEKAKRLTASGQTIKEGDPISIDGMTGELFFTELKTSPSEIIQVLITKEIKAEKSTLYQQYQKIMEIADKTRSLKVRTNADTEEESLAARAFGAEGIGLCRTEHMFIDPSRLSDVRCMFFSTSREEKEAAIRKILPHQKEDFIAIFKAMDGHPVTIRLLDPPLHEFIPHGDEELNALAKKMNVPFEELQKTREALTEVNPMLGNRGCRLGIIHPEITAMQTRAIIEAAIEVAKSGFSVHPEIMIPLVSCDKELLHQRTIVENTANEVFREKGFSLLYKIGTMIELPRAALTAQQIAKHADFFSFGTNDLTQTCYGISRDDATKFVPQYIEGVPFENKEEFQIYKNDPFQILDREGVGELMKIAAERGKKGNASLHLGICGEHGGEPGSVAFCHEIGLQYVSCSPYRVAIARLAAATAKLAEEEKKG